MTYQEAVSKLESFGLKVSLSSNGLDFLKAVATVIKELEDDADNVQRQRDDALAALEARVPASEPVVASLAFSVNDLKDGDVIKINDPECSLTPELLGQIAKKLREASGGKKLLIFSLGEVEDIGLMREEERIDLVNKLLPNGSVLRCAGGCGKSTITSRTATKYVCGPECQTKVADSQKRLRDLMDALTAGGYNGKPSTLLQGCETVIPDAPAPFPIVKPEAGMKGYVVPQVPGATTQGGPGWDGDGRAVEDGGWPE